MLSFDNDMTLENFMTDDLMVAQDEELSASSNEEANLVFEEWKADELDAIMDIDGQIGSALLDNDIFGEENDPCLSPNGPMEELVFMNEDQYDKFALPSLDGASSQHEPALLTQALEEKYQESLRKLAESMKRSHETRKSLTWKTPKTTAYSRYPNVTGVINNIEMSSMQIQQLCNAI